MTQLVKIEADRRDEILMDATERHLPVVISRRVDQNWYTFKSSFLEIDSAGEYMVLAQPVLEPGQAPPEFAPGEEIGLSFRRGHKKCLAGARVERCGAHTLAGGEVVAAMFVSWPEQLDELQRRLYYRAHVPSGRRIEVRIWESGSMAGGSGAPLEDMPSHGGLLQDISAGGCRILVDIERDPHLAEGDTVAIQFQPDPRSPAVRLEAMYRHSEDVSQRQRALGFQFVGLEVDSRGRGILQALTRVVSTFLRIESRRGRKRVPVTGNPRRQRPALNGNSRERGARRSAG